jgi:ATP-binding cassette, subfamily B, bacterial PglK
MFLLSFLELVGLGILIPVINTISSQDSALINFINELFIFKEDASSMIVILVSLMLFFVGKSLYSLFTIYRQQVFVNTMFKDLSVKILERSMSLKYHEFQSKDKSLYLKDIINSSAYLSLCTFNILQFFTEAFVLIAILIFMGFYIGFINILYVVVSILGLAYLFKSVTRNISLYGQQRDSIMHEITKAATEALSGYKEIRNNSVLEGVIEEYEKKANPYVGVYAKFGTISNVPRITLETITAFLIIGYIFYINSQGIALESVLQDLIIFAFVGLRVIPSLTKILGASAQIRYFGTESDKFKNLFSENREKIQYTRILDNFSEKIDFKGVSYKYPSKDKLTLKGLNFTIYKNKKYGFVGKSGSGKSTLFDIILGLNSPISGKIIVDNQEFKTFEDVDVTKLIGIVSQSIFILDGSFEKNILFFDDQKNENLYTEAIDGSQLTELINDDSNHIVGEDGKNLSGGQKQRLAIARSLYKNKNILLLDEATSALDNETERQFINYLSNKKNHTVLTIAHRLTTVKDCDEIFVFKDGSIVDSGSYDNLLKNSNEFISLVNSGEFCEK